MVPAERTTPRETVTSLSFGAQNVVRWKCPLEFQRFGGVWYAGDPGANKQTRGGRGREVGGSSPVVDVDVDVYA